MGWIGMANQVEHYLRTVNADRDDEGKFVLVGPEGSEPVSFLGLGEELVVDDEVCYLIGGERCLLAGGLAGTSYGLSGIKVI